MSILDPLLSFVSSKCKWWLPPAYLNIFFPSSVLSHFLYVQCMVVAPCNCASFSSFLRFCLTQLGVASCVFVHLFLLLSLSHYSLCAVCHTLSGGCPHLILSPCDGCLPFVLFHFLWGLPLSFSPLVMVASPLFCFTSCGDCPSHSFPL